MEQNYESMEPEVQEDEIGPLPCFDVMLEIRRIEMELRRESLIYACCILAQTEMAWCLFTDPSDPSPCQLDVSWCLVSLD
jgi:hypothetical protein